MLLVKVEIDMKYKLLLAIEVFRESIDEIFNLLASSHIFIVNKQAQLLDEEKRKKSHSLVAGLLYTLFRNSNIIIMQEGINERSVQLGKTKESFIMDKRYPWWK